MWFIVTGRVPSKVVVTFFIPVAAMGSVLQLTSLQKFQTQTDACERSLVKRRQTFSPYCLQLATICLILRQNLLTSSRGLPCRAANRLRTPVDSNGRPSELAAATAQADRCCTHGVEDAVASDVIVEVVLVQGEDADAISDVQPRGRRWVVCHPPRVPTGRTQRLSTIRFC